MTLYGERRVTRRLAGELRRHAPYWAMIGTGLLLIAGAAVAAAAVAAGG